MVDGEKAVKIHGQLVAVNARIELIESMSAHADSMEILRWLGGFKRPPQTTFIVHGEEPRWKRCRRRSDGARMDDARSRSMARQFS